MIYKSDYNYSKDIIRQLCISSGIIGRIEDVGVGIVDEGAVAGAGEDDVIIYLLINA